MPTQTEADSDDVGYRSFSPEFFTVAEALASLPEDQSYLLEGFPTKAHALASRRAFYAFRLRLLAAPEEDAFARLTAASLVSFTVQIERALDGTFSMVFSLSPFVQAVRRKARLPPPSAADGREVF